MSKYYKHIYKKLFVISLALSLLPSVSGCSKCEYAQRNHLHRYEKTIDELDLVRMSSLERIPGWEKTEEVSFSNKEYEIDEYKNYDAFSIKENIKELRELEGNNLEHIEYEYEYEKIIYYLNPKGGISYSPIAISTRIDSDGDLQVESITCIPIYDKVRDFTPTLDADLNYTGREGLKVAKYRGFKYDENGNEVYSDWVDSIEEIDSSFIYFNYETCFVTDIQNIKDSKLVKTK
jgi:hypothetical protein